MFRTYYFLELLDLDDVDVLGDAKNIYKIYIIKYAKYIYKIYIIKYAKYRN